MKAPLFFDVFLDSICMYIESNAGELGFRLVYNIDGHHTGRRRPNGSMPCWTLLYADDMLIFEKNREQMQAVLAVVHQALEDWGMQMSISKTKYLHYGTAQHSGEPLHIAQQDTEQVSKFKYLGSMQTSDLSARADGNSLASAANAWLKLSNNNNNNNNNNLSCGNPQPEAIGHTRTCLQPESWGRHYAQSAASSTGK